MAVRITSSPPAPGPKTASELLLACALSKEAATLGRLLPGLPCVATGFGARKTGKTVARLLSQSPSTRLLLFTGAAGGLDPALRLGDVVCPLRWLSEAEQSFEAPAALVARLQAGGCEVAGAAITVAHPVWRAATRRRIFSRTGARICDMETAEALRVCASRGVAALAVKVVTDTADSGVLSFWTRFEENMRRLADYLERLAPLLSPAA